MANGRCARRVRFQKGEDGRASFIVCESSRVAPWNRGINKENACGRQRRCARIGGDKENCTVIVRAEGWRREERVCSSAADRWRGR